MKKPCFSLILFAGIVLAAVGNDNSVNDPIQNYITNFTYYDGSKTIYSSDSLLRLDIDLNHDGQTEMLLSMARYQDGKQGNVWNVYQKIDGNFSEIGTMTFSPSRFYVGEIDSVGRYGLVTFGPGGAGEGVILAYVLDASGIQQIKVGEVRRDQGTGILSGKELLDKYMGAKAINGDNVITTIEAAQLAKDYGVAVEPKTYLQALEEGSTESTPVGPISSPEAAQSATARSITPQPAVASTPTSSSENKSPLPRLILATIIGAAVVGILVVLLRGKPS